MSEHMQMGRRSFLKGALTVGLGAGALGTGMLTGCASGEAAGGAAGAGATDEDVFGAAPDPIDDSQITETYEADVIIVGGGMAGLSAAATAAAEGVDAILISKESGPIARGGDFAAIGTKQQAEAGVEIDKDQITKEILDKGHFKGRVDVVRVWVDNSGETFDWVTELLKGYGIDMFLDATAPRQDWWLNYPTCHTFIPESLDLGGNQPAVMAVNAFEDTAKQAGIPINYNTKGEQLVRGDDGRVTAIIATNEAGDYVKYVGRKAVILATGGYEYNDAMKEKYFDAESKVMKMMYETQSSTGDGHQMGVWAGGAMEAAPHATMKFDWAANTFMNIPLARQPWLWVNANGERFTNEDLTWDGTGNNIAHQPGCTCFSIWDNDFLDKCHQIDAAACKRMFGGSAFWQDGMLEQYLESGDIVKADTLEELADVIGVPADALVASVERYNELCAAGHDDDFNKSPLRMIAIEKAPFYAGQLAAYVFVTLGGLLINGKMQVLDENDQPIPGLYAIGNCAGNFFRNGEYLCNVTGLSLGRAVTFGHTIIKNIANGEAE